MKDQVKVKWILQKLRYMTTYSTIYEKLLRNYIFVPITVKTFGSWEPKGLKFIKEIGRKIYTKKQAIRMQLVTSSKQFL